jgi:SMODS and SLOG-associating 2TM effector domain 1
MKLFRGDTSIGKDAFGSATEYYSEVRNGLREKADHNKHESQLSFYVVICFTLLSPLFVTLGEGWFWGKLVPAGLSVFAAAATSWLQLRKPRRLWAIYRRAQRELERQKVAYDFGLREYSDIKDRDKLLAAKVSEIAFQVHEQWEGLVPEPDALLAKTPSVPMGDHGSSNGK